MTTTPASPASLAMCKALAECLREFVTGRDECLDRAYYDKCYAKARELLAAYDAMNAQTQERADCQQEAVAWIVFDKDTGLVDENFKGRRLEPGEWPKNHVQLQGREYRPVYAAPPPSASTSAPAQGRPSHSAWCVCKACEAWRQQPLLAEDEGAPSEGART